MTESISVNIIRNLSNVNDVEERQRQKGNGKTTTLHVRHAFSYIRCTTTTWKCRISCFLEDVSTRQQLSFTFLNFDTYSLLEFNARKICQNLTYWTRWNKREQIWSSAKSLFKWRFRKRLRCSLRSKRVRLVSGQRKTEEGDFRFWQREKWNESQKMRHFRAVFDSRPSLFAPKPKGNCPWYASYLRRRR